MTRSNAHLTMKFDDIKNIDQEPLVDIITATYNHESFIARCIEGVVNQKTTFRFRHFIGEDASTDGTRAIIETWKQRYPDIIHPQYRNSNIGAFKNSKLLFLTAKAKYIALLDGDDYWTDPLKLQKQVDFLENNPEYIVCYHGFDSEQHGIRIDTGNNGDYSFSFYDSCMKKQGSTLSMMFRNIIDPIVWKRLVRNVPTGDWVLECLLTSFGKGYIMREKMGIYRIHAGGITRSNPHYTRRDYYLSHINFVRSFLQEHGPANAEKTKFLKQLLGRLYLLYARYLPLRQKMMFLSKGLRLITLNIPRERISWTDEYKLINIFKKIRS